MKKIVLALTLFASVLGLAACAELPNGVDQDFHYNAMAVFQEIDDDTMEMEMSDKDDLAQLSVLATQADSPVEKLYVESLTKMTELQSSILFESDKKALEQYMEYRDTVIEALNLEDFMDTSFQVGGVE